MQITFNTAETSMEEATALIALLASLGGRLPDVATLTVGQISASSTSDRILNVIADEAHRTAESDGVTERFDKALADDQPSDFAVDSKGTPWDARIHSESKATVADGTWRKRRGVSDETFAEVMKEIREAALDEMTIDGELDDAPPPPPADEPEGNDEQVPAPPALTEQSAAENAPAAGDGNFPDFASFVAAVAKHGKTYAELNEMAGVVGVAAFKDLKDHADKWDMFFSMIG